jgi:hypothetical protein
MEAMVDNWSSAEVISSCQVRPRRLAFVYFIKALEPGTGAQTMFAYRRANVYRQQSAKQRGQRSTAKKSPLPPFHLFFCSREMLDDLLIRRAHRNRNSDVRIII